MDIRRLDTRSSAIPTIAAQLRPPIDEAFAEEMRSVEEILRRVRTRGDAAVLDYVRQFDTPGMTLGDLEVTPDEIDDAFRETDDSLVEAVRTACENVRRFHAYRLPESWSFERDGVTLGQRYRALNRVGVYVPGGTPLPSSVYMGAVPARVAGVREVIVATPAGRDGRLHPLVLVAARLAGVDRVFKIGSAWAVGAMAFGTERVPRVDKVVGPGNIYVLLAKRAVFGYVGIESLPGPSDVLVIADEQQDPAYVAADMLSQAEHGAESSAVLVTPSATLIDRVAEQLATQLAALPRREQAALSLARRGALVLCRDLAEAADVANAVAPEHLEILVEDEPEVVVDRIENAGAIFVGRYTPEPLGDYIAGPSHILPTEGTSRFASPLSVDDFLKKSSVLRYSKAAFGRAAEQTMALAEAEGLDAHARSVRVRL